MGDPTLVTKLCGHTAGWCSHGTLAEQVDRIPDRYLPRRLRTHGLHWPTGGLDFMDKADIRYTDGTTLAERLARRIDGA
jgi:hypothetical protein